MASPEFDPRPSILIGDASEIYLQRTLTILRNEGLNPSVAMEFVSENSGILCGMKEALSLLAKVLPETGSEVWALEEGESIEAKEVALRIKAPYSSFALYETTLCGLLASCTGWATAARKCVDAAQGIPVVAMAASQIHPNVVAIVDYASVIGGCVSVSTVSGARLSGITPSGNMPSSLPLLMGDTVKAMQSFDRHMPQDVPRIALIDTIKDESEEALNVARALRERLRGVSVNTPPERGGVTIDLIREIRSRLDLEGFQHVEIFALGNFNAQIIEQFVASGAPINGFGINTPIADARPNKFTADIHEIDGKAVAKRGKIPGLTQNHRLDRVM